MSGGGGAVSDNSSTDIVIIDGNSGNITTGDNAGGSDAGIATDNNTDGGGTDTGSGSDTDISIDIIDGYGTEDEQIIY